MDDNRLCRWDIRDKHGMVQNIASASASPVLNWTQGHQFTRGTNFQCFASTGDGSIVVGSVDGKIRLYSSNSMREAKTIFPGLGLPITHVDVTYDGKWVLGTTDTYLVLISTLFIDKDGCGSGKRVKVGGDGEDEQKKVSKRSNQSDLELSLKEAEDNENSSSKDTSDDIIEAETVEQDSGVDVGTLLEKVLIKAVPKKLKDLLITGLMEGLTVRYKRGLKMWMRAPGDLGLLGVISGCGILGYWDACQGTNVSIGRSFANKLHQLKTSVLLPSNPQRMTVQVLTKRPW
ncbi:hypothetical protein Droror1_Dr00027296 [Drosera rotundifolia]